MKICENELETLNHLKKQAERDHRVANEQATKQKQDLDNISSKSFQTYFLDDKDHNKVIEKEKKAYDKCQEKLMKAKKEMEKKIKEYNDSALRSKEFHIKNKRAIDLLNEQMQILNSQFEGEDGSELENKIEAQVLELDKEQNKLKTAINRWNNSRFILIYSCNQIQNAEEKWDEVMKINLEDPQKVLPATECINNLISCHENLEKCQTMLKNVMFPFCTPEDRDEILKLTDFVYEDMKTNEGQLKVKEALEIIHKSCLNLKRWFDSVIKNTLLKRYSEVIESHAKLTAELRIERINLLQQQIKEKFGKDIDLGTLDKLSADKDDLLVDKVNNEEENNESKMLVSSIDTPNFELPPPPSKDQILGDIEIIKKEYRNQTSNWNKHLDDSRKEADEKLKNILSSFNKVQE